MFWCPGHSLMIPAVSVNGEERQRVGKVVPRGLGDSWGSWQILGARGGGAHILTAVSGCTQDRREVRRRLCDSVWEQKPPPLN